MPAYSAAHGCRDATPLYLFDQHFAERCPALLADFAVPEDFFPEDLLAYLPDEKRPPYRWVMVGPRGSGTDVHRDPSGTGAWNALLSGEKLWALVDPTLTPEEVGADAVADTTPVGDWFVTFLPGLLARGRARVALQRPGDVVYVPPGEWHAVWNLTVRAKIKEANE